MADDALRVARQAAAGLDPIAAATRVGAAWDEARREFALPFFGSPTTVMYPEYEVTVGGRPVPPHIAALVVYHLAQSDGTPPAGTWISFADLPDGSFYVTAFRGYTGAAIARRFAAAPDAVARAVARVKGTVLVGLADRAWRVPALPRLPIALLWWDADDEFEARAELLFDASAAHHINTEGCAILGSWLTSLLVG
jgi:hypothetical protein